ncbi:MAG: beta-lactamase family protein, partial [Thermoguttaceae bacterium]|nr:beta-lactamase family protein [Thermoguttaceae bacterium]
MIHPFESDVMKGCPPLPEKTVTPDTYSSSRPHRVWAHQHIRELCATQAIGRGHGPVAVLPRKPRDIDRLPVTGPGGKKTTLAELLKLSFTDAFLVLHNGAIVTEQYFSGMTPETPHSLASVSKSISIGVLANVLAEGRIQEDADVSDYIPELAGSGYRGATVRQLMDMQSGVKYDYGKQPLHAAPTEGGRHFRAGGMFRRLPGENPNEGQYAFLPTLQRCRPHGSIFYYKCSDTAVLAWACERVTGTRFSELVSKYIWSKLGAEHDGYTVCDVQGFAL